MSLAADVSIGLDQARGFLAATGWLARSPAGFRDALVAQTQLRRFERGEKPYLVGDPVDGLYGVVHGGFAFEIAPYERGPNYAHKLRCGFWFGELELLRGKPRLYTMSATRPTLCLFAPLRAVCAAADAEPGGWRALGALCADHLEVAIGAMDDLTIRDSKQRVAAVILRLIDGRVDDNPFEAQPELDATQDDLAIMANLGRATTGRCLGALEAAGLIERGYRVIRVRNQAGLRRLLEELDTPA